MQTAQVALIGAILGFFVTTDALGWLGGAQNLVGNIFGGDVHAGLSVLVVGAVISFVISISRGSKR